MGEKTQDGGKEGQDTRTDEEIIAEKLRAAGMEQQDGGKGAQQGGKEDYSDNQGDAPPKG